MLNADIRSEEGNLIKEINAYVSDEVTTKIGNFWN